MDIDDEADDPEIIDPYEEVDPLNPPPPGNFYVGEGSSSAAYAANHHRVFAPGPLGKDVNALHYKVKSLAQQMSNRAETEFSTLKRLSKVDRFMKEFDLDLRDEIQSRNKLEQNMTTLEDQRPYDATVVPVAHVVADDPYIPAATDDPAAREETPPFKPQGSPPRDSYFLCVADKVAEAITANRATRNTVGGSGGNLGGSGGKGGAPAVHECTFTGFIKCNPTVFYEMEGDVELCRWFEKTKMVIGISECAEGNK
ncbi:hypothetical protein Tco_0657407, partial [Tanacetum coccineum]